MTGVICEQISIKTTYQNEILLYLLSCPLTQFMALVSLYSTVLNSRGLGWGGEGEFYREGEVEVFPQGKGVHSTSWKFSISWKFSLYIVYIFGNT